MNRTRVRITIRIKERVGVRSIITYSTLLLGSCNWICAPKPSHASFCSTDVDFSVYQQTSVFMWSRFHRQSQKLINFILMKIQSGKNLFLPAKTIFASPVFTIEKQFFHHLAKTCQPWYKLYGVCQLNCWITWCLSSSGHSPFSCTLDGLFFQSHDLTGWNQFVP